MGKVNRKAQVTTFIIIGIVILITALLIYFSQRSSITSLEVELEQKPDLLGQTELKNFVDSFGISEGSCNDIPIIIGCNPS